MIRDPNGANSSVTIVFSTMSVHSNSIRGCAFLKALLAELPHSNGKSQPWTAVWPPAKVDLQDVAESEGQMLLLDGTGGAGTKAVPNSVYLPPKLPKPQNDEEDKGDEQKPKAKDAKSGISADVGRRDLFEEFGGDASIKSSGGQGK
jgi:hypothetical protein